MILGDPAAASGDHPADIDYGLLDLGGNVTRGPEKRLRQTEGGGVAAEDPNKCEAVLLKPQAGRPRCWRRVTPH